MSLPEKHFRETEELARSLDTGELAEWLLQSGYYPEEYVLPPCFSVEEFSLDDETYFSTERDKQPPETETIDISFPKSRLTERTFGIFEPRIYHDLVFTLLNNWTEVLNHLFNNEISIYSYSFPIPMTSKQEGSTGPIRSGRMIYEYIQMAEKDLLAEAHKYGYLLRTDVTSFYPSLYSHSIPWALHGKGPMREPKNRHNANFFGNVIDLFLRRGNDGCTNGLPIGPALSDLIAEIVLSAVDRETSMKLKAKGLNYMAVRFKDDYRFLCNSDESARVIITTLQETLKKYRLHLQEEKSSLESLPGGLYRPWIIKYYPYSLKGKSRIGYKDFENTTLQVLRIDEEHPGTGILHKFLSELTDSNYMVKLRVSENNFRQLISMLLMLKDRNPKTFPHVLGLIEAMMNTYSLDSLQEFVNDIIREKLEASTSAYDRVWLLYFSKYVLGKDPEIDISESETILRSILSGKQEFFSIEGVKLFQEGYMLDTKNHILKHLHPFRRKSD